MTTKSNASAILERIQEDSSLWHKDSLRLRLLALDALDSGFGLEERAEVAPLRDQLEAANEELYESVRREIRGGRRDALQHWLEELQPEMESECPSPGLGFDARDDFMAGIFQHGEPGELSPRQSPEMVHYQPTPVRHVLRLLELIPFSKQDVFVDLGSGLGNVALLISLLTGASSVGIEVEPAYVASARECAERLGLSNTSFVAKDARAADLSQGSVFYLYSPFTGSLLQDVLDSLRVQSKRRPIKLCSLGPCTRVLAEQAWLRTTMPLHPGLLTVFESRSSPH